MSAQTILTRSLREPGGPCTKSMEVSESRMERVNCQTLFPKCVENVNNVPISGGNINTYTVEPRYNEVLGNHENYLVISGFSLHQGKKTKKYKELGLAK